MVDWERNEPELARGGGDSSGDRSYRLTGAAYRWAPTPPGDDLLSPSPKDRLGRLDRRRDGDRPPAFHTSHPLTKGGISVTALVVVGGTGIGLGGR